MLYNTEAIVVRNIAYGESDAIVTLLTPSGRLAVLAKGAKKPQSRYAAGVQLCVQGVFTLYRRSGMGTLSQVEIVNARRHLREDLQRAAYAAYFCELATAVAEEAPHGSETLYRLLVRALDKLEAAAQPPLMARVWETKILRMAGASPDWTTCVRCGQPLGEGPAPVAYLPGEGGFVCRRCLIPGTAADTMWTVPAVVPRILKSFESVPWTKLGSVQLRPATHRTVRRILEVQLRDFAGLSPKSRAMLESIDAVFPSTEEEGPESDG